MGKVVLFIAISLDGYIAKTDGSVDWLENYDNTDPDDTYEKFYSEVGTVVMGRTTYDQVADELFVGEYPYSNVKNYVLTSQKREDTDNIFFVNQDVTALVRKLKTTEERVIWIVGGTSVVTPLLEADLIDEYQVAIIPVLLGKGIPLFKPIDKLIDLKLTKSFQRNQYAYLIFQRRYESE